MPVLSNYQAKAFKFYENPRNMSAGYAGDLGDVVEGTINLQQNNVRLSIGHDGALVTMPWYVMNSANQQQTITVWETRLMEQ